MLKTFDARNRSLKGAVNTFLGGINSVAIAGPLVLLGSNTGAKVVVVDVLNSSERSFNPGVGRGCTTAVNRTTGNCSAVLGHQLALVDLSTNGVLSKTTTLLSEITILALSVGIHSPSQPQVPHGGGPHVSIVQRSIEFGVTLVTSAPLIPSAPYRYLQIHNAVSGGVDLQVNGVHFSHSALSAAHSGPFAGLPVFNTTHAGTTAGFDIISLPTAEKAYSALCTLTTNDPLDAHPGIPLTSTGGRPHTTEPMHPQYVDFGTVPVGTVKRMPIDIANSGDFIFPFPTVTVAGHENDILWATFTLSKTGKIYGLIFT